MEFIFQIKESLTKGSLTVELNPDYACPISHLSDNYRHIFIQTNNETDVVTVSSGTENEFVNGQPLLFIPKVNLTSSNNVKINIAGTQYNLKYQNILGNEITGVFIAGKPYGLTYNNGDFIYKEYDKIEIVSGIAHYWDGVKWCSTMPAGMINAFDSSSAPTGYLLCNGSSKNKNDYPELFSVIGYRHGGSGDNFNLPDLRGKMILGVNGSHSLGSTGGSETKALSINEMPKHKHGVSTNSKDNNTTYTIRDELSGTAQGGWGQGLFIQRLDSQNNVNSINISENYQGSGASFSIMNPYMSMNYFISTGKSLI